MSAVFSLISLVLALACYACGQLQQHGQLRWMKKENPFGFWGEQSDKRKFALDEGKKLRPRNPTWYHEYFTGGYSERWFTSTWLTVAFTDGYHFMQFMFFNFLALGFTLAIGWSWWLFGALLVGIRIAHWAIRETFNNK